MLSEQIFQEMKEAGIVGWSDEEIAAEVGKIRQGETLYLGRFPHSSKSVLCRIHWSRQIYREALETLCKLSEEWKVIARM